MFGKNVGFTKFKPNVKTVPDNVAIPDIVFMRGGSVAILVLLECEGQEHVILTLQPRVAVGKFQFPELPAGMLDGNGNFNGKAAEELREETGIVITENELIDLTALICNGTDYDGVYPSPGACDEFIRIYLFQKTVTAQELLQFQGKITGKSTKEQITLKLVPLQSVHLHSPDMKVCLFHFVFFLYFFV